MPAGPGGALGLSEAATKPELLAAARLADELGCFTRGDLDGSSAAGSTAAESVVGRARIAASSPDSDSSSLVGAARGDIPAGLPLRLPGGHAGWGSSSQGSANIP